MNKSQFDSIILRHGVEKILCFHLEGGRRMYFDMEKYNDGRIVFDEQGIHEKNIIGDSHIINVLPYHSIQLFIFKDDQPEQPIV